MRAREIKVDFGETIGPFTALKRSSPDTHTNYNRRSFNIFLLSDKTSVTRMDHRTWGEPRNWRCFHLFVLVCLCLAKEHFQHVAAADTFSPLLLDSQGASEDSTDSRNKLDSLSHLLPFTSDQDTDYKRSSSFFPLRGKKMTIDPEFAAHYGLGSELDEKRSQFYPLRGKKIPDELKRASYFMPMRGRKEDVDSWMEEESEDSLEKRMSSFMPMRGKKQNGAFQHLGKPGTYPNEIMYPSSSGSNSAPEKRKPSSFLPVRGKRSPKLQENRTTDSNVSHSLQKRSVGFMPMRGRRMTSEDTDAYGPGEIATSLLEKKLSSFMPMRGRRYHNENGPSDDKAISKNQSIMEDKNIDNDEKRASSFMPMRGRKASTENAYDYLNHYDLEELKRGRPSFNAMRGRRSLAHEIQNFSDERLNDERLNDDDNNNRFRRASSFMPMRGRRSEDDQILDSRTIEGKRLSFIPMRGRRMVEEPLADEPMKKFQFMPMRGRRSLTQNSTANDHTFDGENSKRGSSYFMPMRGRREASYSSYVYSPAPYFVSSGIGSSLMTRHFGSRLYPVSAVRSASSKHRKFDWDSVKRAFHATRGKRVKESGDTVGDLLNRVRNELALEVLESNQNVKSEGCRCKRSLFRPNGLNPQQRYIALKRPMSFFATRGKRLQDSALDSVSKQR